MKNLIALKCQKCGYKATLEDYLCPNCKVKFKPTTVKMIGICVLILGILNLSLIQIVFGIGILLLKQWARKWFIIGIFVNILLLLLTSSMNPSNFTSPFFYILLLVLLLIELPMAIYLIKSIEAKEAFEFYGGRSANF